MKKELLKAIKTELSLVSLEFDEIIMAYISDGEEQIKSYLGTDKLTSTLIMVIHRYTVSKLVHNDYKYQREKRNYSGLDSNMEQYAGLFRHYKKTSRQFERGLCIEKKKQRLAREKFRTTRKNKK